MPEDAARQFILLNITTPVPGTLMEVIDNAITIRYKTPLNGLGTTKGKSGGAYIILKIGLEVAQDHTVFNYGPPRP